MVDIFESEWINIFLMNNWQKLYKFDQTKIYFVESKNCEMINEIFDKLYF